MDITNKNVIVLGGAGFIGSALVDELLRTDVNTITVYDNFTRGVKNNLEASSKDGRVNVVNGDITDLDSLDHAIKGQDVVFHFAALWLLHCFEYPREAFEVNIGGTFNVLELCVKHEIPKLVYSSSASVYGDAMFTPMTESHPFNNKNFYGATKIAGEQMCRAFSDRYGLDYVGLRYMNVYGPRQDYEGAYTAVMMKMLDRIDEGKPLPVFGDGSQTYDFVYVNDVARANLCAAVSDSTDAFYNVGTGIGTSVKKIAEILLDLTESDVGIKYEPEGQTFVTNRIGSIDAAREHLGFTTNVNLVDGLKNLVTWRNEDKKRKMMDS